MRFCSDNRRFIKLKRLSVQNSSEIQIWESRNKVIKWNIQVNKGRKIVIRYWMSHNLVTVRLQINVEVIRGWV